MKGVFNLFTKESGLVEIWVGLVLNGTYKLEEVPSLSNLKELVAEIINEEKVNNEGV